MAPFVLVCLLAVMPAESHEPDQTERVIDLIADYQVNHDKVFENGFVFVGKGLEVVESSNNFHTLDHWYLCAYEGPQKRLDAYGRAGNASLSYATWMQFLEYDNKHLFRPSIRHATTVDASTEQWKKEEEKKRTRGHLAVPQPMRSLLKRSAGYRGWTNPHNACGSEFLMSDSAEMIEGKYTKNGDIEATFRLESNIPLNITIKFGKKQKFLPIETLTKVQLHDQWITDSQTEVTWEHRGGYSVPNVVKFTEFPISKTAARKQLEVKFDWRIGPQVTKSIDPDLNDWREPFREMFDLNWR